MNMLSRLKRQIKDNPKSRLYIVYGDLIRLFASEEIS